jgi:hypothetical protein
MCWGRFEAYLPELPLLLKLKWSKPFILKSYGVVVTTNTATDITVNSNTVKAFVSILSCSTLSSLGLSIIVIHPADIARNI